MRDPHLKWFGKVVNGRHQLYAIDAYRRFVRNFEGREVETVTRLREKETTNPQYRYLFGCLLPILADHAFDGNVDAAAQYIKEHWHFKMTKFIDPQTGKEREEKVLGSFARGNISRKDFAEIIDHTEELLDSLELIQSDIANWEKQVPEISWN